VVREVNHPNIGLMLDSFRVFLPGSPMTEIADIPGEKIFLVEVGDFAASALEPIEIGRHYRLFPGEGNSPIEAFLRQVAKTGYTGCLSVEVFNAFYRQSDPFDTARRGAACMSRCFSRPDRPRCKLSACTSAKSSFLFVSGVLPHVFHRAACQAAFHGRRVTRS
jgi:sugar phosphate isomerase/epimerase